MENSNSKLPMIKHSTFALALLFVACNATQKTPNDTAESAVAADPAPIYAGSITEQELRDHLFTYASDEFEGRSTGKEGQKKAVQYLKAQYEAMGVPGAVDEDTYFQDVPLEMSKLPEGSISIGDKTYDNGSGFVSFSPITQEFNQVVFAGYGVEEGDYSDYRDLDVKGKVVLIRSGEPMNEDGTFVLSGTKEPTKWSNLSEGLGKKVDLLTEKGAAAILYYDPKNYSRYKRSFDYMKDHNSGRTRLKKDEETSAIVVVNEELASMVFENIDNATGNQMLDTSISFNLESSSEPIKTENVVAIIEGETKPNEYIVISSHLDHVGIGTDGQIYNGADDDGSGTVAMLEIAEAFKEAKKNGQGPARSIVFLHVTGEEIGLLGSKYYTDIEPLFPLENTVANLNIDMIGRIDPKRDGDRNYIYLIGSDKLSTELHEISEAINEKYTNITLDYTYNDENDPNRFYYRSDHYNFAKNNIPIIFYFNGTHDDYHQPSDTPDKINYDLLKNRARLVFHTAWELANREDRIVVDKAAK